jgi:hypothetical protein
MKSEASEILSEQHEWLLQEVKAHRQQLAGLEQRVARLELSEELWQEPGSAGDTQVKP